MVQTPMVHLPSLPRLYLGTGDKKRPATQRTCDMIIMRYTLSFVFYGSEVRAFLDCNMEGPKGDRIL